MSPPIWFQLAVKWHAKTSNDFPSLISNFSRGPTVVCVSAACQSRAGRWHSCLSRAAKRS